MNEPRVLERMAIEMRVQCGKSTDAPWETLSKVAKKRWLTRAEAVANSAPGLSAIQREGLVDALRVMLMAWDTEGRVLARRGLTVADNIQFPAMGGMIKSVEDARTLAKVLL